MFNWLALAGVVRRRLFNHLNLMLAVWAGFALAIALAVSIPIYAEAVGYRILLAELAQSDDRLPPFAMVYTYGGASTPPVTWPHYQQANQLAGNLPASGIQLPIQRVVRYVSTEKVRVMVPAMPDQPEVLWARLAFITGFQEQVRLVDGDWPAPYRGSGPIDVLVSEPTANRLSLLVDDRYELHTAPGSPVDLNLPVRIAGIWRPIDSRDSYWFNSPSTFGDTLIVDEESFAAVVNTPQVAWVRFAAWYSALDGTAVRSGDVPRLLEQIDRATGEIQRLLPGAELSRSPTEALVRHRDQVRVLTVTLTLFSVPLLGLLGYFIVQVAGMVVQRQQQEIAVLRSRGSSRLQVLGLALGEGLALSGAALAAGLPLGLGTAQLIAWTRSFLRFGPTEGPPVTLLPVSWRHGALVAALVLPAILAPALRASRRTIISYKQERARSGRGARWARVFLGLLLLAPALYGYQQLKLHGMIGVPGVATSADDPFRNPVLLLAPTLFVFSLGLLALQLLPGLLELLAWLLARAPGVALLTALRFLARTTQAYAGPVLLITLTLSLASFTASMARTLDGHSLTRAHYRGGADIRLAYVTTGSTSSAGSEPSGAPTGGSEEAAGLDYIFVPVDEYLKIAGVRAVGRVAPSNTYIHTSGGSEDRGTFVGVDRDRIPAVLADAWRDGYAAEPLGALMNRLADDPAAAVVSAHYAAQRGLRVGDRITLDLNDVGQSVEVPFVIAGIVEYFPTLYPEAGPFVIGNLDYSFEQQSSPYPYEIWMDLAPGAAIDAIKAEALGYGLRVQADTPQALLEADMLRPERQGLFGLLSVGFLAAGLVTIVGFLVYTLISFQRRLVELGVLRAIGLSTRQLATLLISEQALVIGVGILVGTGLGVLASRLFLPFMQVRAGEFPDTPPFVVQIAWDQIVLIYAVAGGLLALTVGATLVLLRRMRLFEAVKLGEAF